MIIFPANGERPGIIINTIGNIGDLQGLHHRRFVIVRQTAEQIALCRLAKNQPHRYRGQYDGRQYYQRHRSRDSGLLENGQQPAKRSAGIVNAGSGR